jgi:hypothetical protein
MPQARDYLDYLEAAVRDAEKVIDPCALSWISSLRAIVEDELPEYTNIHLMTVYRFRGKRGQACRGVVTKENAKTWVVYETSDSSRPGTRWMISKGWCTTDNIERDSNQAYELPAGVKIK